MSNKSWLHEAGYRITKYCWSWPAMTFVFWLSLASVKNFCWKECKAFSEPYLYIFYAKQKISLTSVQNCEKYVKIFCITPTEIDVFAFCKLKDNFLEVSFLKWGTCKFWTSSSKKMFCFTLFASVIPFEGALSLYPPVNALLNALSQFRTWKITLLWILNTQ